MAVLTTQQLQHLERRLLQERERAMRSLGIWVEHARRLRGTSSELDRYRDHMADQGTEAMEREIQALLATRDGRYLHRIDDAIRRLRTSPDKFGICQATGRRIGFERLDTVPHVRYCVEYSRSLEDEPS